MKIARMLNLLSIFLFLTAGVMTYAYVYDVEYVSPEKEYQMDRDEYYRSNDAGYGDFMSFSEWMNEKDRQESAFHDWVKDLYNKVGPEAALCFDPTFDGYQDTREGQLASAPENWNNGRDD